ncbi:DUF968 domain-containing protein [Halomonas elongata]|uniref:DUF968 domain-containing protein n=1 Tax=Halomonas elongata (strain ATCC 33173 / DSM 2581 / NBRC 15536 / NCIMB 2198 / 1H9) TaxID=768066 RepID=E1VAD6_HALED|nr:DUF968 domain-containing protein [Halomonas elongata]WBF19230.1 DUF968 domain-containing protein [Halomonas elongata]WPU48090.1 DUF968 domain-containing protein [Halomonas elongata DSM 2581]CBV41982.1 uncharacterized protein HELO_2098 [Halomonas elongata DSM 2581]
MKRSPIQRKTPLRSASPAKRKPVKRTRQKGVSDVRFRSEAYLRFVRSLPCCVCGAPANAAHHLIGMYQASGMGLKAADSLAMPVCDGPGDTCHRRIHSEAHLRWQQPIFLIDTINTGLDAFPEGSIHDALIEARDFVLSKEGKE